MPPPIPVTTPVVGCMVATPVALDDHVPPLTESSNVILSPSQSVVGPVITEGIGFTVMALVIKHPVGRV